MRYAVLITGPAGAGKSTFASSFVTHLHMSKRTAHLVNFDPAARPLPPPTSAIDVDYVEPTIDIRDLINLEDVMSELEYGPNGGLVYCFEYLLQNMDWLDEELNSYEDDYLIFDCPGQIELYTHHPFLPTLVKHLSQLGMRTCAVYLIESQFMEDRYKYFSGVLSAMSAMVNLEVPWINVLSKMDLVTASRTKGGGTDGDKDDARRARIGLRKRRDIARYLEADPTLLGSDGHPRAMRNPRFHSLNQAIVQLIEDHPLVNFMPLDLTNPDSLEAVVSHVDYAMQYGEDEEPRPPRDMDEGDFAGME